MGIAVVSVACVFSAGCGKKKTVEPQQEVLSIEMLSTMTADSKEAPGSAQSAPQPPVSVAAAAAAAPADLPPLPPAGPYKPSIREIQAALKAVGVYSGKIDGISGPMTRRAIKDFQKANGLKVDGIVGPKTWSFLREQSQSAESTAGQAR